MEIDKLIHHQLTLSALLQSQKNKKEYKRKKKQNKIKQTAQQKDYIIINEISYDLYLFK